MKRYIDSVKKLFEIAGGQKLLVLEMFISCGLYNFSTLLPPIATSGIIAVISDGNFNGIWIYVLMYLIFYIMYFSFLRWNSYTYTKLADYYHMDVQKKLFEHISNNDSIFGKISKGKIVDTCSDDIRYLVDIVNAASEALMRIIQIIIIFIVFIYYNVYIGLFVILVDIIYIKLMNNNSKKVSKYYEGTRKYEDKIIDILNQMLANIKQIKSLNIMPNINKNLDKSRNKWREEYKNKRSYLYKRSCVIPYLVYVVKILLYIVLAYLVVEGNMSIDKLVLLIGYFELIVTCTDKLLAYLLELSNYEVRVNRIKTILDYKNGTTSEFGIVDNDYINGLITFSNVSYKIKNKDILNKVTFKVYPNEITTIVGHSGSGKTTIINLLYRLNKLTDGRILIDNESIYNYTKKVYASNVSGVFQKSFIFNMSIRDNLGLVDNNLEHQMEACKRVGIHDYIMSLPKTYSTVISEESHIFSEGQIQLLSIARAILTKAEILLFDEVTSNIDQAYTSEIATLLKDLKDDHTILMITHKPEMMEIADKVIVLDKGKVICKGKNEEVYNKCLLYQDLRNRTFASISKNEE